MCLAKHIAYFLFGIADNGFDQSPKTSKLLPWLAHVWLPTASGVLTSVQMD